MWSWLGTALIPQLRGSRKVKMFKVSKYESLICEIFFFDPLLRLSITITFSFKFKSESTRCEPINPAPPVIKYIYTP